MGSEMCIRDRVSTVQQIEEMLSILEQAMQEVFEKVDLHSNIKFSDPCAF